MTTKLKIRTERVLNDLTGVGKTVLPLVKQLLGTKGLMLLELLRNWNDIVGEPLAQYTLPQKISFKRDERQNGTLILLTLSGAFAMEVKQREPQILQKVNVFFGYPAISTLKIMQTAQIEDFNFAKKPIENSKKTVVSAAQENYITELTQDIQNDELRAVLQNLGKSIWRKHKQEGN